MIPDTITVSASRKLQVEQYEPFTANVEETYSVPDFGSREEYESWRDELQDQVALAAENAAMRRYEEQLRDADFSDE